MAIEINTDICYNIVKEKEEENMSTLFEKLVEEGIYSEWASLLDWLFDDKKFTNWSSGYVGSLSKKIKRLNGFGKNNYIYDTYKNISYPGNSSRKSIKVVMTKGNGETKDLVRHIRNGIAHGNSTLIKNNGKLNIEIMDYNTSGQQTAYIYIPIDYITKIHALFKEVEKSKNNDRCGRKTTYKKAA